MAAGTTRYVRYILFAVFVSGMMISDTGWPRGANRCLGLDRDILHNFLLKFTTANTP